eukprot:TRINITY_DN21915_c0_g1_i1.p1 TRINITY_DN21915_c0_g1~~TRINITY_DN21915_c0_g1_i1.p1  ORF type:complete len:871 (+),score=39.49 TRINITY_DN21915_c0_g1_i1:40-2652(+)
MAGNLLKQTRHKLYELEDQNESITYDDEQHRQDAFASRDVTEKERTVKDRTEFAQGIKPETKYPEDVKATTKNIQTHIEDSRIAILDVEIEQALADLELLSTFGPEDCRKEVGRLRNVLQDIVERLPQGPVVEGVPSQQTRLQECKELHDRLLHYELQLTRDGTKIELDGLKAELQQLEEEEIVAKAVEKETTDTELNVLYDLIKTTDVEEPPDEDASSAVESTAKGNSRPSSGTNVMRAQSGISSATGSEMQAASLKNISDAIAAMDNSISGMKYGERNAMSVGDGKGEDGFKKFQQMVADFSSASGIGFAYVPAGRYSLGIADNENVNMLAALDHIENKTQWELLSEQQKENSVGLSSIGLRPKIPDGSTFMSYIPPRKVDLGGFFISVYPVRMTDWQNLMGRPEFQEKLSKIVTPTLAEGYKHNYCPQYLAGQMFGFTKHKKNQMDDTDSPSMELPYWTAVEVATALGCRLPTWQEWEVAARGPEAFLYPWGNQLQMDAVELEKPLPVWDLTLRRVVVHDAYLDADANTRTFTGRSIRVKNFGVYEYSQSPFGLRRLVRPGYEWNSANFDLSYPAGPTTHLVRTLSDYHTQYILEGGDQTGNHRSFTGPVVPLFARPYGTVRNAAFRLVFSPARVEDDVGFTNRIMQSVLAMGTTPDDTSELESKRALLRPRTCGGGGGVLRGSPAKLSYGVGTPLTKEQLGFEWLLLLFGMGEERVLATLGEPENRDTITPMLFERATHWKYHSIGVMISFDATFKRKVVKEIHLWDSTAEDLLGEDWNRYPGDIDANGLSLPLTFVELEKQWGPAHNQWSNIVYYLREYLEFCPESNDPTSLITNTRRRHASSSLAFEFTLRIDRTIMKTAIKLG